MCKKQVCPVKRKVCCKPVKPAKGYFTHIYTSSMCSLLVSVDSMVECCEKVLRFFTSAA